MRLEYKWKGILDALLIVRDGLDRPQFLPLIGTPNIHVFWGLLLGLQSERRNHGNRDYEFEEFIVWLRDVRHEWPNNWHDKYLEETNGDHFLAIKKLVDFAFEFRQVKA